MSLKSFASMASAVAFGIAIFGSWNEYTWLRGFRPALGMLGFQFGYYFFAELMEELCDAIKTTSKKEVKS